MWTMFFVDLPGGPFGQEVSIGPFLRREEASGFAAENYPDQPYRVRQLIPPTVNRRARRVRHD